jgi:hypothetical protein
MINNRDIASELMSETLAIADGLGLSGTNILAVDSKIDNGDDCFAITTPSRNIPCARPPAAVRELTGFLSDRWARIRLRSTPFGISLSVSLEICLLYEGSFHLTRSDRPSGVCRGYHDDRRLVWC